MTDAAIPFFVILSVEKDLMDGGRSFGFASG
jgi:hypothetical protein